MFNKYSLETRPLPLYRKDVEQALLRIPGVTEAQMFAKLLVRCEFPIAEETSIALQELQDWIEHETGWKVEMTISGRATKEAQAKLDQRLLDITRRHLFGDGALTNFEHLVQAVAAPYPSGLRAAGKS